MKNCLKGAVAFFFLFFLHGISIGNGQQGISYNVKVLCAVWDLMHYTFNIELKLIKGTNAEFTTSAHIAQNTCYRLAGFSAQKLN